MPRNTYRTRDGRWLALSAVTDRLVAALLLLMGRDPEAERGRFGSVDLRRAHEDELDSLVAQWIATRELAPLRRFDLIAALAVPLPVTIIAEMLGIAPERRADFKRWSDSFIHNIAGPGRLDPFGDEVGQRLRVPIVQNVPVVPIASDEFY